MSQRDCTSVCAPAVGPRVPLQLQVFESHLEILEDRTGLRQGFAKEELDGVVP